MLLRILQMALLFTLPAITHARIIDSNTVTSQILKRDIPYSIYLPDGYDTDIRSYPVIYLLHGYGDDHTAWTRHGNIAKFADDAIKSGRIPPVIIVMPDGGVSMYVNSFDKKCCYEDFFINEFMSAIEGTYRIRKDRFSRAVTGQSMGGWGCMIFALKHPDLFIAAAPMSAGIHDDNDILNYDDQRWEVVFGSIFGHNIKGSDRLNACWYAYSTLKIAETMPIEDLRKLNIRISCGDQDYLLKGSLLLHNVLSARGVHHTLIVNEGDHNWAYWRSDVPAVLDFLSSYIW